jgi:hypothetical protein
MLGRSVAMGGKKSDPCQYIPRIHIPSLYPCPYSSSHRISPQLFGRLLEIASPVPPSAAAIAALANPGAEMTVSAVCGRGRSARHCPELVLSSPASSCAGTSTSTSASQASQVHGTRVWARSLLRLRLRSVRMARPYAAHPNVAYRFSVLRLHAPAVPPTADVNRSAVLHSLNSFPLGQIFGAIHSSHAERKRGESGSTSGCGASPR